MLAGRESRARVWTFDRVLKACPVPMEDLPPRSRVLNPFKEL